MWPMGQGLDKHLRELSDDKSVLSSLSGLPGVKNLYFLQDIKVSTTNFQAANPCSGLNNLPTPASRRGLQEMQKEEVKGSEGQMEA